MHFIFTNNHLVTHGDISIIPTKFRNFALEQKNNAILANNFGWFCPPVVVGIGQTIQYIV
jgi:hypothetical protein